VWFLVREHEKLNRALGTESAPLQRANCFETAKDSDDAVVFPGHWEWHQCANLFATAGAAD